MCTAYGNPIVSLSWYFNDSQEILKNITGMLEIIPSIISFDGVKYITRSFLNILHVTKDLEGLFICEGENNVTNFLGIPKLDSANIIVQGM